MPPSTLAADLPAGSVVAARDTVYLKSHPTGTAQWRGSDGGYHGNWRVEDVLTAGGTVRRRGYGDEVSS